MLDKHVYTCGVHGLSYLCATSIVRSRSHPSPDFTADPAHMSYEVWVLYYLFRSVYLQIGLVNTFVL